MCVFMCVYVSMCLCVCVNELGQQVKYTCIRVCYVYGLRMKIIVKEKYIMELGNGGACL